MSFELFENPWASGGAMHRQLPYVQASQEHGWGHGNDYFQPKTKDQIRKEALIQLAILAVVVAAPLVIGAVAGAGAAGAAGAGGTAAGAGTAVGGASAQAATGAITQGAVSSGLSAAASSGLAAGATSVSASAAASAGASAAASSLGISLTAGASAYAAMQPFLDPQNVQTMQVAAGMGTDVLLNLLQKQGPPRGDFVYNPNPEPDPVDPFPFDMYQNSPPSRSRESATAHLRPIRLLDAVSEKLAKIPLMRRLAERMVREKPEVGGSQILDGVGRNPSLRNMLAQHVVEAAKDLGSGNVWEGRAASNLKNVRNPCSTIGLPWHLEWFRRVGMRHFIYATTNVGFSTTGGLIVLAHAYKERATTSNSRSASYLSHNWWGLLPAYNRGEVKCTNSKWACFNSLEHGFSRYIHRITSELHVAWSQPENNISWPEFGALLRNDGYPSGQEINDALRIGENQEAVYCDNCPNYGEDVLTLVRVVKQHFIEYLRFEINCLESRLNDPFLFDDAGQEMESMADRFLALRQFRNFLSYLQALPTPDQIVAPQSIDADTTRPETPIQNADSILNHLDSFPPQPQLSIPETIPSTEGGGG
jgi:hypothetical protein